MVTPISTVDVVTVDCDPVSSGCRCGMGEVTYYSTYYHKVAQSRCIFVTVTGSPAVFGRPLAVTQVAALSTARTGVTTT